MNPTQNGPRIAILLSLFLGVFVFSGCGARIVQKPTNLDGAGVTVHHFRASGTNVRATTVRHLRKFDGGSSAFRHMGKGKGSFAAVGRDLAAFVGPWRFSSMAKTFRHLSR